VSTFEKLTNKEDVGIEVYHCMCDTVASFLCVHYSLPGVWLSFDYFWRVFGREYGGGGGGGFQKNLLIKKGKKNKKKKMKTLKAG
jgi:hypothetical protein